MVNYQTNFDNRLDTDSGLAIAVICLTGVMGICCICVGFCNYFRPRNSEHKNQNYPIIVESPQHPEID